MFQITWITIKSVSLNRRLYIKCQKEDFFNIKYSIIIFEQVQLEIYSSQRQKLVQPGVKYRCSFLWTYIAFDWKMMIRFPGKYCILPFFSEKRTTIFLTSTLLFFVLYYQNVQLYSCMQPAILFHFLHREILKPKFLSNVQWYLKYCYAGKCTNPKKNSLMKYDSTRATSWKKLKTCSKWNFGV